MATTKQTTVAHQLLLIGTSLALLAIGCSGGSDGKIETVTIADLTAAVAPAAQALLDAPALEATTLWFDENGEHVRTEWLDYRNNGSFLLVTQSAASAEGSVDEMAIVRSSDLEFCATTGPNLYCDVEAPQTNEPWTVRQPREAEAGATQVPISLDLAAMATASPGVDTEVAVTRQRSDRGEVTWVVSSDGAAFTQEWIVGPDGSLRSYTEGSETGLPLGLYSKTQFDFVIVDNSEPLHAPSVGSPLDLGSLGLSEDIPLLN